MDGTAPTARPSRILLVEDHTDTLELLSRILRSDGHHVITARGFHEALTVAERAEFDFLVADIQLADGSGWTLLERLREKRPRLIGIAVSGHGLPDHVRRSLEAGYCRHMTKPIDFNELTTVLKHHLATRTPPDGNESHRSETI
jgi:hypothetical protein